MRWVSNFIGMNRAAFWTLVAWSRFYMMSVMLEFTSGYVSKYELKRDKKSMDANLRFMAEVVEMALWAGCVKSVF